MAEPLKLVIGRQNVTNRVSPSEAGYIQSIRQQNQRIRDNLLKVIEHVERVTPEAIAFGLEPAFKDSQRLVPVDTGRLKKSGFLETRRTASGAQAVIGYGRNGRPFYAPFVHERLDVRHAKGKQAKFLEEPILNRIDDFRRRVVLFMQRSIPGIQGKN